MTTNKKKTFAERARDIKNKYKRAEFDALEQKDMEAELESLMAEQEAVREAMGLNEQQPNTQMYDGFNSTQTIEDINNPKQYPNGRIYQDNRGWMERGLDRLYGSYEANKPQLLKDFPILDTPGMMLQYVTGNTPSDGNVQGGAPLMVGGRGFKNIPVQRTIPKQTFSRAPLTKSTFTPTPKVEGDLSQVMDELVNAPGGLSKQFPRSATSTVMDELVNAPGGLSKQFPQGATRLGYKAPAGRVSGVNMSGSPVNSTASPVNPTVSNGQSNFNIPWGNIGYGAAGTGGAGLLGLGIYGLTQLPDGRVVDKQGNVVPPQVVQQITNTPIDATSGANMSIANTPVSKQAGFTPTKEYLDAIGWNSKLPTVQQVKQSVKGSSSKGSVIKQPLVTSEFMTPEQSAIGIETDIRNANTFFPEKLNFHPKQSLNTGLEYDKLNTYTAPQQSKAEDMNKPGFWNKNKQYLPYAISGASNIVGNLLLANAAKKIPQVQPVYATPEKINLEPKANVLRQQADISKNVNMMNARNLGLNPGATLGSMGVINSGVDRGLSDALTNLYLGQEQANVGAANQFALQNQDAANRVNSFNAGLKYQGLQDKLGYLGAALGTIPGVMKDIRADKADKEMRAVMDSYYKSLGGKNYLSVGSIFDTSFGKYKVKGYNPDGTPITEKVK